MKRKEGNKSQAAGTEASEHDTPNPSDTVHGGKKTHETPAAATDPVTGGEDVMATVTPATADILAQQMLALALQNKGVLDAATLLQLTRETMLQVDATAQVTLDQPLTEASASPSGPEKKRGRTAAGHSPGPLAPSPTQKTLRSYGPSDGTSGVGCNVQRTPHQEKPAIHAYEAEGGCKEDRRLS